MAENFVISGKREQERLEEEAGKDKDDESQEHVTARKERDAV